MARPKASELTERELEIMHFFWNGDELTVADVQSQMHEEGRELAYTTIATLIKILLEKGFVRQTTDKRPHAFKAARSHKEVSGSLLRDLMQRVFRGSAEDLVLRLMEDDSLTSVDRKKLQEILKRSSRKSSDK